MTSLAYEVFRLLTCCDLHFIQLDLPTTVYDGKRKTIIVCSALADGDRNERC
jgi:hypothetical protein